MKNRDLIINLIQKDLKHNQLVLNLNGIGLDCNGYYDLSMLRTVAKLMGIKEGSISDQFGDLYESYMQESVQNVITHNPKSFADMATKCYESLLACVDIEDRQNSIKRS